jgi:hypothetical protein
LQQERITQMRCAPSIYTVCLGFVFGLAINSPAQTPPATTKQQPPLTARNFLEDKFQTFLFSCVGEKTLHTNGRFFGHPQHQIPAIPGEMITENSELLNQNIFSPPVIGNSLAVAFTYVFSKAAKDANQVDMTDNGRRLDPDPTPLADAPPSLTSDFTGAAYSRTCGQIADVSVQGGASFPIGDVKALLNYQYDQKKNSQIVVAMGPFDSPFNLEKGAISTVARIYRDLLIWGWYMKNPTEMANTNYLYNQFIGLTYYQTNDSTTVGSLTGNVSMSIAAPFASISGSASGKASSSSTSTNQDYQTLPFLPVADTDFVQLPLPDFLISDFHDVGRLAPYSSAATSGSVADTSKILISGQSYAFDQSISGMPSAFCDPGQWDNNIKQDGPAPSLATIELSGAEADQKNPSVCIFHLQLSPQASIDPTVNPALNVQFALQNTITNGPTSKSIALKGAEFSINVSQSPNFLRIFPNAIPTPGGAPGTKNPTLQWTNSIAIDDTDNPIVGVSAPKVFSLTCGGSNTPLDGVIMTADWAPSPNKVLTLTTTFTASDPGQIDISNGSPSVPCTLSANLVFTMKSGPPITKTQGFSVKTYLPVPVPAAVTTTVPTPPVTPPAAPPATPPTKKGE